jgi:tetratricopeptide (TPR) repeat protein
MDDMVRILIYIVVLGFLLYMIRYTRFAAWVFLFITIAVIPIFALLDGIIRNQPLLTNPNWNALTDFYLVAVMLTGIGYALFRMYWPYPRMRADSLWEITKKFYSEGDNKQAWRTARQLMAKEPRWWGVRYLLGCICNQRGQYRRALWHLTFANELEPNQVEVLHELGYAYLMKKKYGKAKAILEQAQSLDANHQVITGLLEECQRAMCAPSK